MTITIPTINLDAIAKDDKKRQQREADRRYYETHREKKLEYSRRWKEANREKVAEYSRQYNEANREKQREAARKLRETNPEKTRAAVRRYREAHPEKRAECVRQYYEANPEKIKEAARRWRKANPERVREIRKQRRVLKINASGNHTEAEWQALCDHYGNKCLACGDVPNLLTRDHIVPLSMGGSDDISNIQPLCGSCNSRKNARVIDYRKVADV